MNGQFREEIHENGLAFAHNAKFARFERLCLYPGVVSTAFCRKKTGCEKEGETVLTNTGKLC